MYVHLPVGHVRVHINGEAGKGVFSEMSLESQWALK